MKTRVLLIAVSVFLFAFAASPMWADAIHPTIKMNVLHPVVVPGHVLEPGQYYVANLDMGDVVMVRSADGTQAFFEMVDNTSRQQPANGAVVDVAQHENSLPRIIDYFYPGNTDGTAFLYPLHPSVKTGKKPAFRSHAS